MTSPPGLNDVDSALHAFEQCTQFLQALPDDEYAALNLQAFPPNGKDLADIKQGLRNIGTALRARTASDPMTNLDVPPSPPSVERIEAPQPAPESTHVGITDEVMGADWQSSCSNAVSPSRTDTGRDDSSSEEEPRTAGTTPPPRATEVHEDDPPPSAETNLPSCSRGPAHTFPGQPQKRKPTKASRNGVLKYLLATQRFSSLPFDTYEKFIMAQLDRVSCRAGVSILEQLDAAVQAATPGQDISPSSFVLDAVKRLRAEMPPDQVRAPPPQRGLGGSSTRFRAGLQERSIPVPAAQHRRQVASLLTRTLAIGESRNLPHRQVFQTTNTTNRSHSRSHKAVYKHTPKAKTWVKAPPTMTTSVRRLRR